MIISHGRKYIFVHIPKTGGTSLSLALEARVKKDDILIGDTPKAKKRKRRLKDVKTTGRLWKHSRLIDIYGLVTQDQIEEYFVFTIVRNPWDRMVSYYHWLAAQSFDHPAVSVAKENDFKAFLADPMIQHSLRNDVSRYYVSDQAGNLCCNLYLRIENLADDIRRLEQNAGLKLDSIPHLNQSSRDKGYCDYYDMQSRRLIETIFAEDIEKFKYTF